MPTDNDPFAHLLQLEARDGRLVFYHATLLDRARSIVGDGFTDARGTYGTGAEIELNGVFLSNRPLDVNEGAKGSTLLRVLLAATEADLDDYELKQDPAEATYREWCVPAALLNERGTVEFMPESGDD